MRDGVGEFSEEMSGRLCSRVYMCDVLMSIGSLSYAYVQLTLYRCIYHNKSFKKLWEF